MYNASQELLHYILYMMWSGCTLQPLASGPKINYNEMLIKRQAYNE